MSPSHHPSEHHLVEHAAGGLAPGHDLVIAAHVTTCGTCQAEVRLGEAVGGALLDALPPEAMAKDALARALARIERPAPPATVASRGPPADWIGFSSPAVDAAWRRRRWAAPGVWVAPVIRGPGRAHTYLLRVAAGMAVPYHRHKGRELVTVLKGAYEDRGDIHQPGDFAENDDVVEHRPTVTRDGECVCLISADAPLVALDWVGKLFQPFVRI
jgi:putative transcriptional regulator